MLRISTLGRLSFRIGEAPIEGFVSKKAEAILTYLVCTDFVHSRDALAAFFWEGYYQERRLANLRVVLSNLNKLLPQHCQITRHKVSLKKGCPIWLDAAILEDAICKFRGKYETLETDELKPIENAINLYQGEFLHGFHVQDCNQFQVWAAGERQRLRELALEGIDSIMSQNLRNGDYYSGIEWARKYLYEVRTSETVLRKVMFMYYKIGQRDAAIQLCQDTQRILEEDYGMAPQRDTEKLCESIRDGKSLDIADVIDK